MGTTRRCMRGCCSTVALGGSALERDQQPGCEQFSLARGTQAGLQGSQVPSLCLCRQDSRVRFLASTATARKRDRESWGIAEAALFPRAGVLPAPRLGAEPWTRLLPLAVV